MNWKARLTSFICAAAALSVATPRAMSAESIQDQLFARALQGATCEQIANNGRYCRFKFEKGPEISIKDAGGSDTVIGFHKSNIDDELYAVMYFGCVAVVPGMAHPRKYDRNFGVFISPTTGLVYRADPECRRSLK